MEDEGYGENGKRSYVRMEGTTSILIHLIQ